MTGLLADMAVVSADRLAAARAMRPAAELAAQLHDAPPIRPLVHRGFDLIAEIKLRSPSAGALAANESVQPRIQEQARAYVQGGAAALSVLTEPTRFDGDLSHLAWVAEDCPRPVMRKDFLVDPYQVREARLFGASGVLLILRMLSEDTLKAMIAAAQDLGMFVLLEAFDGSELDRAADHLAPHVLLGLNTRDLETLAVVPDRLESLADRFPVGCPRVAESGIRDATDAGRVAGLGYDMALVGTALMSTSEPEEAVREMVTSGRDAREASCAYA